MGTAISTGRLNTTAEDHDAVWRRLSRARPKLVTFDLFDTLLTRAVADPEAVFLLLGHRLGSLREFTLSPEVFARARLSAERQARSLVPRGQDVTLMQILTEPGCRS